jgi:uncharacterized protein
MTDAKQLKSKLSAPNRSCALAVMAKAPLIGTVKTRLVPPLTHEEAASLSRCFLRDTADNIADVGTLHDAQGVIVYTPAEAQGAFDGILPKGFQFIAQRGASLGERLLNATSDLLAQGYDSICLINSDSPTLPPAILRSAISALAAAGDRLVLGAADDGGYYLIGLKQAHANLFKGIAWSTADVLAHTLARAREISLEVVKLADWYDVDDAASLERLCEEFSNPVSSENGNYPYAAPHTRAYLTDLLEKKRGAHLAQTYH